MNNAIFCDCLNELNKKMCAKDRKILLLLDNAASQGKVTNYNLTNVKVKFLRANTTSHLLPLNQGIIRNFKALYRRHLLKTLISSVDSAQSVTELCKSVTLLDAAMLN